MQQSDFHKKKDGNYLKQKFAEMTDLDGKVNFMDIGE